MRHNFPYLIIEIRESSIAKPAENCPPKSSTEIPESSIPSEDLGTLVTGPRQLHLTQFPRTQFGKQFRSFSSPWYVSRPWLEYSLTKDAAFCFCCRLFVTSSIGNNAEEAFMSTGVSDWKNAILKFDRHVQSKSHADAFIRWNEFQTTAKTGTVVAQLSIHHHQTVSRNREYLSRIIKIVLFLAKQGLAFRGNDESYNSRNKGNFLELVDFIASIDSTFSFNLRSMPANANYLSHDIQNEIIDICAKLVKEEIFKDIRCSGMVSVMADETRDVSKKEQLSICFRFVSPDLMEVREEFLTFHHAKKLDASSLASLIENEIKQTGINKQLVLGQCYDGASVMSGCNKGVQALLRHTYSNAVYIHCFAHRLNLVLTDTVTDIPMVSEFFALVQALYVFISRSNIHSKFLDLQKEKGLPMRELPSLSETRWACRWRSLNTIRQRFDVIVELLSCDFLTANERVDANGLLHQILALRFISCLLIFHELLSITHGLNEALQSPKLNIGNAVGLVEAVLSTLQRKRCNDVDEWTLLWTQVRR
jgi:hypothetical protein